MFITEDTMNLRRRCFLGTTGAALIALAGMDAHAATYYVRQTVGNDANDGRTPATAWLRPSKLSAVMEPGDRAYIGPGLYRDSIAVARAGLPAQRTTIVADTTGHETGDPPGVVMLSGADPVDETRFEAEGSPGVYQASFPFVIRGAVEMDGPQFRYLRASQTSEHQVEKVPELDVVRKLRGSYSYDEISRVLTLHTTDDNAPTGHEIELIVRGNGVAAVGWPMLTVVGFTFRHFQDAGVNLFLGSSDGLVLGNTVYGSRQGVRVHGTGNVLVYGNTFFRNENSGAYFVGGSAGGQAISNIAYENVKGLRWGSRSDSGMAIANTLFENLEGGISLEESSGALLRENRLMSNAVSQVVARHAQFRSDENCFQTVSTDQLVADFDPFPVGARYASLAEYRAAQNQDLDSRSGGCGERPRKLDVQSLHAETQGYVSRARQILDGTRAGCDTDPPPALSSESPVQGTPTPILTR